ncbi:MAG: primosomal protein N' [Planctomycetaceae bacterium]|jgi:primosomal protein N' (replication factor Y)|nr:primosomal protein N' [Planctomycetaceae bacterium]
MCQLTFFEGELSAESEVISTAEKLPDWELDDLANRLVARVVFPGGYDAVLDYFVPAELEEIIESGMRVMAPLGRGNRLTVGYCIDIKLLGGLPHLKDKNLKSIQSIIDNRRLLDENMIRLTHWIANEYICPVGQVLEAMLPAGVRSNAGNRLATVLYVTDNADKLIDYMKPKHLVQRLQEQKKSVVSIPQTAAADSNKPNQTEPILTIKQLHVLETLRNSNQPLTSAELQTVAKCSAAPIDNLKRLGLIRTKTIRRGKTNSEFESDIIKFQAAELHKLNSDQINAITKINRAIELQQHKIFLLHGVTGSGKTEVYIQSIQKVVSYNRQAIVLVPEISLTPQTVDRFKSRFKTVAVLHSHLTDADRHQQWSTIASGKIQVVVGARSAIFAPFPNLGLIVIDEEHESSFKQGTAPRYHARDVACKRAELENIPLILGSATPSMETWYAAAISKSNVQVIDKCVNGNEKFSSGESIIVTNNTSQELSKRQSDIIQNAGNDFSFSYELIAMPSRVKGLDLPRVEIVDLREEVRTKLTYGAIHRQLHKAIEETIKDKGQVILLLNRRGFSTHIQCPSCGEVVKCVKCDVSLTHHKTEEIALCHHCDYNIPAPNRCDKCGFVGIRYQGFGTQKLEVEIRNRFPNVSILRMDTDTMRGHGMHEKALAQFRDEKIQILIGTQMIAKGLDFPNVTLVGVINADTALHLPDFRASERTFHLITQVAGRTGRSERGGRVIVQTFTPDHQAIQAAAVHDYAKFVKQELPIRKLLGYPPFSKMVRIIFRGENENQTAIFAKDFAQKLNLAIDSQLGFQSYQQELSLQKISVEKQISNSETGKKWCKILGPAPAPFSKLRGMYRFHLHLYSTEKDKLLMIVRNTSKTIKTPSNIQWIIDVDPIDML